MKNIKPIYGLILLFVFGNLLIFPQNVYSYSIIKDVTYEGYPLGIEFNPEDKLIYIAAYSNDALAILDPKTDKIIKEIAVGNAPADLAIDTELDRIFVTNRGSNDLSVVNLLTRDLIDTVSIGQDVWGVAVDPVDHRVFVGSWVGDYGEITILDGASLNELDRIKIPGGPIYQIAINPINNKLYVTNHHHHSVTIVDTNTLEIISDTPVKGTPFGIKVDEDTNMVYVTIGSDNSLSIIDGDEDREIKNIKMHSIGSTYELDIDPVDKKIFVANYGAEGVSILDSSTYEILKFIPVDGLPFGIAFDNHNKELFVGIPNSNIISILSESLGTPSKPIADAGHNQLVNSNEFVQLDGSNSSDPSNSELIYIWSQESGPDVVLSDTTSVNPSFTAPEVDEQTEIVFNLTVSNEFGLSDSDLMTVIINPLPPLVKPVANAGFDQSVKSNDIVQLDGSNSSDPNGSLLSYFWNQTSGPEVTLSDSSSSNPTFTAPEVNEQTEVRFQLTVTNEEGTASDPDEITIIVNPATAPPPNEEPKTIGDLLRGIIQNPLDVTNSLESANEIKEILTDGNRDNDQMACDLINWDDESTSYLREILNC